MTEISPTTDHRHDNGGSAAAAAVVVCRPPEQAKMAAIAMSLNVRLKSADMPSTMQEHALRHTFSILHEQQHHASTAAARPNLTVVARSLKQEFDKKYGPAWHCVAGKSFGSFVTHTPGGFIYFTVDDSLSFLLFKTEVRLVL